MFFYLSVLSKYVLLCLVSLSGVFGLVDERPECALWAKLENKTVPLQNQGHANCTTNEDCTGFNCVGIYQVRNLIYIVFY
jgi:hypothetical protein